MNSFLCFVQTRSVSFFNKKSGVQLWKAITSVSSTGKKRGRSKGIRPRKDLNRGQHIGEGMQVSTSFPGLNTPLLAKGQSFNLPNIKDLNKPTARSRPTGVIKPTIVGPANEERIKEMHKKWDDSIRDRRTKVKLNPLERGWRGVAPIGRRFGAPLVANEKDEMEPMEGFDSMCLDMKRVAHMTGRSGRINRMSALMVVGNGKGAVGWAVGKQNMASTAIKNAIERARKRIINIELFEGRTIYQDFYAECNHTRVFAQRAPKGDGLRCHRALHGFCQMTGIKDIYVKCEGASHNVHAMIKAFFTGLLNQETFEQLAERKRLHVVEFSVYNKFYPKVIASPTMSHIRTDAEIGDDEVLDVEEDYGQERLPLPFPKDLPPKEVYANTEAKKKTRFIRHPFRNEEQVKIRLMRDCVVRRWRPADRRMVGERMYEQVMQGAMPVPIGIGLGRVDDEQLKKVADNIANLRLSEMKIDKNENIETNAQE